MTIEEKAKAYDEALIKAKELLDSPRTCFGIVQLKDIFPELRGSEDESLKNKSGYYKGGKFWKASTLWQAVKNKIPQRVPNRYILQDCTWNISSLRAFADEVKNVQEAELDYPIILDINGNILDGAHRVVKAYLQNKDIDVVYLGDDEWPEPDYDEEKAVKESEDERIRKGIIEELKITRDSTSGKNPYSDDPDIVARLKRLDEAIDYLEKQKEQKSLNISAASEWLRKHVCTYMNSEYNEFHKCVEYDGSIDKERFINDFEEAMRKEQKPNFYEKDSTDFEIEVHEIIAQARNDSRLNDADVLKQFEEEAAFALMLKANKLIEQQKPAEWSEEDDWKRKELIQYLEEKGDYRTVWMTWLKSLRPQPKQEWSEEDKERYISCLKRLGTDNPAQPETINSKWFKEHVSFRPSWKPSEEDKQCLDTAIELLGNLGYDGEADNLKQLKKQI